MEAYLENIENIKSNMILSEYKDSLKPFNGDTWKVNTNNMKSLKRY
ncbi:hypothetical protein [Clostridium lacusfryxellense]|nr:hypothetical protein [Clostridium lacusfryxellense]MBU3114713.1 hypothetical protein [Clostridium lacusfryxellense]